MFNQTYSNIEEFHFDIIEDSRLNSLSIKLDKSQNENRVKSIVTKRDGNINVSYAYDKKLSKPIIDEIDRVLAEHYGFTEEELDFIINYDIKYRMGDELNAEE